MTHKPEIKVTVTHGKNKTTLDAVTTDTVGDIRTRAMEELHIVADPSYDYFLNFKGRNLNNESENISTAVGPHPDHHVHLTIEKIPKGG